MVPTTTLKHYNMKRTISSCYSDDNWSHDGVYVVDVPDAHEQDYRQRISRVGKLLSETKFAYEDTSDAGSALDSVAETHPEERGFMEARRQQFTDAVEEGFCSLSVILDILGWMYERLDYDVYDADYDEFV